MQPTGGTTNYFFGKDPVDWRTNIPNFTSVRYQQVYQGIDLIFRSQGPNAEYDFVVAAGADPSLIQLSFSGMQTLDLSPAGELTATVDGFEVRHRKPVVYQTRGGQRREIDGRFVLRGPAAVAFELGQYDPAEPLVIDPVVSYSAIIGGSGVDLANAIAVDAAGNAYVAGVTSGGGFPSVPGSLTGSVGQGTGFVFKLNPSGTALLYSAIITGVSLNAIAVDGSGNAYAAGWTASFDVGVVKLNASGSALLYSFVFGGAYNDFGYGIAIDPAGNAYVTGATSSSNFPTTPGAFKTATGSVATGFVAKVNASGSALIYSTFLGGNGGSNFDSDTPNAIAVDSSGNAYIGGATNSTDFPVTPGAFQTDGSGCVATCGFVAKLNPAGSALVYSTLLEGSEVSARGIAVEASGYAYVAGTSDFFDALPGNADPTGMFVLKLNPSGSALAYFSLIGSNQGAANAIAIDLAGNAYVTGWTTSDAFPLVSPIQAFLGQADSISGGNGTKNVVIVQLDPAGNTLFSSYLGGQNNGDTGSGIAVGSTGKIYVVGTAGSISFPVTPGAAGKASADGFDAFVTSLDPGSGCAFALTTPGSFPAAGGSGAVTVSTQASCGWFAISNQPWITITGGASGIGPGSVNYTVAPNGQPARSAPMSIAGLLSPVSQANGCTYSLSGNSASVPAAGTTLTITLATNDGCPWTVSGLPSWIIPLSAGPPFNSSTQFVYIVTANTSVAPRSATLTLAGQPFTINEDAGYTCQFQISLPSSSSYDYGGAIGTIQLTTTPQCSWSAASDSSWFQIFLVESQAPVGPLSGVGSGQISFFLSPNNTARSRVDILTIARLTFTVTQAGAPVSAPTLTSPANGAAGVSLTPTLSWPVTLGADSFDVYFGTSPTPPFVANVLGLSYTPPALTSNATYYWQVVSRSTVGSAASSVSSFSTYLTSCSFSAAPASILVGYGGGPSTINVTAGNGCAWTATGSATWLNPTSASGIGNGVVSFISAANISTARFGTVNFADQSVGIMQAGSPAAPVFNDVLPTDPYFDYVSLLHSDGVTAGCSTSPPLYCPGTSVTRAQMSVFIVAALDRALGTALTYSQTPYFQDVPADSIYFPFVQRIKDLGITAGCSVTPALFCPDSTITQGQMAVFMIVGWMLKNNLSTFSYTTTPYFTDVPSTDIYFKFVQKMQDLGIWTGCSATLYCESSAVTRDQMAPMILRSMLGAP